MECQSIETSRCAIDRIARDYLYQLSFNSYSCFADHLSDNESMPLVASRGFLQLDNSQLMNGRVVNVETLLEGHTRVFLINPIIKALLDNHHIKNEWQFNSTFNNFTITNREYEKGSFLEFIAVLAGKKIGFRYTPKHYSLNDLLVMKRDNNYSLGACIIPGFDLLSPIDDVYTIDWTGLLDYNLQRQGSFSQKKEESKDAPIIEPKRNKVITAQTFFELFISIDEYNYFISVAREVIVKAREIIALQATPQLLPSNILDFKMAILDSLSKEMFSSLNYIPKRIIPNTLTKDDILRINSRFFGAGYRRALVGSGDFAESFITSEYLYRNIQAGLSIDYTAVLVGYLKSVEQLLYTFYLSAFSNSDKLCFWDRCKNKQEFNPRKEEYRLDPYDPKTMQKKYDHYKKTGRSAPEIGELTRFIRYYQPIWNISEQGKEYVFSCLEDYRRYCRNDHFHKDNIGYKSYRDIENIRNNTLVCLYYLLGGFRLLDTSKSTEEQLSIVNYEFEKLYKAIRKTRPRVFEVNFNDEYNGLLYYLNDDYDVSYNAAGLLLDAKIRFVKMPELDKNNFTLDDVNKLLKNREYISNNILVISHSHLPSTIRKAKPKR